MRQLFSRPKILAVAAVALCLASCSSSNKGKIEGKWKSTTPIESIPAGLVTAEFKSDGSFAMSAGPMVLLTAQYKLGMGDYVTLSDVKKADGTTEKPARVKITITGDNMKWIEDKKTYEFAREKPAAAAPEEKK